ncbi:hypothetical protein BGZ99_008366 [Dissophora globulifera]|uniref:PB1 domain-containing protein n=1 Tax=Dissophora globulifera TaxID=979702 RepID=A0A9P6RBG8_9FUNG|nr:hypothetical protein BGZ99_008366 [Dissophora globulifera]
MGIVYTTKGDTPDEDTNPEECYMLASNAFAEAAEKDPFFAAAYFQRGVANIKLHSYSRAWDCFNNAYDCMRGNKVIDYTQLGMDFKLYSCQILFNRGLCYLQLEATREGMADLERAADEKQTPEHDILDQALVDNEVRRSFIFSVPPDIMFQPAEFKVKNAGKKDYLGSSRVVAAVDASKEFKGFKGTSGWQLKLSGPTSIEGTATPSSSMDGILQRRATTGKTSAVPDSRRTARRGGNPDSAVSFGSNDDYSRGPPGGGNDRDRDRGAGGGGGGGGGGYNNSSGPEWSSNAPLLVRRNTERVKPTRLNTEGGSPNNRGGAVSASAASGNQGRQQQLQYSRNRQEPIDDLEQRVYPLNLEPARGMVDEMMIGEQSPYQRFIYGRSNNNSSNNSTKSFDEYDEYDDFNDYNNGNNNNKNNNGYNKVNTQALSVASELRGGSPIPTRSSSVNRGRNYDNGNTARKPSQLRRQASPDERDDRYVPQMPNLSNLSSYSTSPPAPGPAPYARTQAVVENMRKSINGGRGRSDDQKGNGGGGGNRGDAYRASPNQTLVASSLSYSNSNSMSSGSSSGRWDDDGSTLRVRCYYKTNTAIVKIPTEATFDEICNLVSAKFKLKQPIRLKYRDEDSTPLIMTEDDDWQTAQEFHFERMRRKDPRDNEPPARLELWCEDEK